MIIIGIRNDIATLIEIDYILVGLVVDAGWSFEYLILPHLILPYFWNLARHFVLIKLIVVMYIYVCVLVV